MMAKPALVLLDEPSMGLAPAVVEEIFEIVRDLNAREQIIVRKRLMADEPRTLQELGDELGVSKERVRQLEQRTLIKLRQRLKHVA